MSRSVLGCGSHTLPDEPSELKCMSYFDPLLACYAPTGIFRGYYRWGTANECSREYQNLAACWKAKVKKGTDYERAKEILLEAKAKTTLEPPSEAVWTLRTSPPPLFQKVAVSQDNSVENNL